MNGLESGLVNLQNKRKMLVQIIKTEMEYDRLIDLLAEDYMQQAAHDLKDSVEDAERGNNGR